MIMATSSFPKKMPVHSKVTPPPSGSPDKRDRTNLVSWVVKASPKHLSKA